MTPIVRRLVAPAAIALIGVSTALTTACGSSSSTTSTPSASSTTSAAPATPSGSSPNGTATGGTAAEPVPTSALPAKGNAVPGGQLPVLAAIRTGVHSGFDRLVLEFNGGVPAYTVRYVRSVTEDPRGGNVPLKGTAFLQVVLPSATLNDSFQGGHRAYTGPQRVTPDLPAIKEVAVAGDFEAVLTFGVGVAKVLPFRVTPMTGPFRLVIDVAHPAS